jgi:hypothetical protein
MGPRRNRVRCTSPPFICVSTARGGGCAAKKACPAPADLHPPPGPCLHLGDWAHCRRRRHALLPCSGLLCLHTLEEKSIQGHGGGCRRNLSFCARAGCTRGEVRTIGRALYSQPQQGQTRRSAFWRSREVEFTPLSTEVDAEIKSGPAQSGFPSTRSRSSSSLWRGRRRGK